VADGAMTQQDWYFNPSTSLPLRVDFVLPDAKEPNRDGTGSILYTSWQANSGVGFPKQMLYFNEAMQETVLAVNSIGINQGLPAALSQVR
jgi:hypothetical protein